MFGNTPAVVLPVRLSGLRPRVGRICRNSRKCAIRDESNAKHFCVYENILEKKQLSVLSLF
jgi:hypothetical protein